MNVFSSLIASLIASIIALFSALFGGAPTSAPVVTPDAAPAVATQPDVVYELPAGAFNATVKRTATGDVVNYSINNSGTVCHVEAVHNFNGTQSSSQVCDW